MRESCGMVGLGRLERWVCVNFMKFSKAKYKVLP